MPEAMQRLTRRRDPLRVRVRGEQRGLLGVGAKAADHDQADTVRARRRAPSGRTPVRRRGASACPGGTRAGRCTRQHRVRRARQARRAARARPRPCASPAPSRPVRADAVADGDADAQRCQRVAGKRDVDVDAPLRRAVVSAVAAADREVLRALEVRRVRAAADDRRREHPRRTPRASRVRQQARQGPRPVDARRARRSPRATPPSTSAPRSTAARIADDQRQRLSLLGGGFAARAGSLRSAM